MVEISINGRKGSNPGGINGLNIIGVSSIHTHTLVSIRYWYWDAQMSTVPGCSPCYSPINPVSRNIPFPTHIGGPVNGIGWCAGIKFQERPQQPCEHYLRIRLSLPVPSGVHCSNRIGKVFQSTGHVLILKGFGIEGEDLVKRYLIDSFCTYDKGQHQDLYWLPTGSAHHWSA